MCGIAGAFGTGWQYAYQTLNLLSHRGPNGQHFKNWGQGYFGHTRLAIVDVAGGDQPLPDTTAARWLVCNGEIYNHPQLRQQFPAYPFKTYSDSEDILAVYAQHGVAAPQHLEGMYAFAILDDDGLFLARDPLGIKPLYYGRRDDTFYFASEIKALQDVVATVAEFPPGYWYSDKQGFVQYYAVPEVAQALQAETVPADLSQQLQQQLRRAVQSHLMSDVPLGVFLSGGLDSSIIAALVAEAMPEVHSFAVGMATSPDMIYARAVAAHLGTIHHEYIYTEDEMLAVLPEVIYYLESFDPALVRSAVANYFLARLARQYVTVVLSGEGADELFSGYHYLKQFESSAALHQELVDITVNLHNSNLQRLDRMTMAHGLEGRVPFLDREFMEFAWTIPLDQKLYGSQLIEKWILRKAFEDMLPSDVVWRAKQKFSEGAGSAHIFEQIAATTIDDATFGNETRLLFEEFGHHIRSKEELYYYRIFRRFFKPSVVALVGFSRSL